MRQPLFRTLPLAILLAVTSACGVSERQATVMPTAPSTPSPAIDCQYGVSPVQALARRIGGSGEFTITAGAGCGWTVHSAESWIRIQGATSGTGSARIVYDVDRNPEEFATDFRKGTIELRPASAAGENVWIWQFPGCATAFVDADARGSYLNAVAVPADGGQRHIQVLVESWMMCPWTTQPPAVDWLSLAGVPVSPSWRSGDADLFVTVAPNPSSAPRGTVLIVGEKSLTINQAGR
jgi:hypothetical protein